MFSRHTLDLVITDVIMPVMDGHEFCRHLREFSRVPIMMLSGQVDLEDGQERRKRDGLGINYVMSKPIHMAGFLNAIQRVFSESGAETQTVSENEYAEAR